MKPNDEREVAEIIWQKLKGTTIPDTYGPKEVKEIIERYWHRAMESEQ